MIVTTWASMGDADDGSAVQIPSFTDQSVQVVATGYASATLVIQGSNDNTNWVTLTDALGNNLSFTSGAQLKNVLQNPLYIRPNTSGGSGTDLTVILISKGQ